MNEVLVIFSLAATGCLVRLSMDLALQFLARRLPSGRTATYPAEQQSGDAPCRADPMLTLGATLACYGLIALVLISLLPGPQAFERTLLAIALFCVGGIIGEISRAHSPSVVVDSDVDNDEWDARDRSPSSVGLSVALMLALNLAVAVLVSGQGLLTVVPPRAPAADNQSTELEQIVVVARRGSEDGSTYL